MSAKRQLGTTWRKSARSGVQSNCVEARYDGTHILLRNSNDPGPGRPIIAVPLDDWLALLDRAAAGDLALDALGAPVIFGKTVLVGFDGRHVTVRVATERSKRTIRYTPAEWRAFLDGVTLDHEFTVDWLVDGGAAS